MKHVREAISFLPIYSYLDVPQSDGAGLSLPAEEVEEDQMFVVPVYLQVVVGGELGEVPQVLLDPVHVEAGAELHHRALGVGEEPPAVEVAGHHVPPHPDAAVPRPPPLPHRGPEYKSNLSKIQYLGVVT